MNNYTLKPHDCCFTNCNIAFTDSTPEMIAIAQTNTAVVRKRKTHSPLSLDINVTVRMDNTAKSRYFRTSVISNLMFSILIQI